MAHFGNQKEEDKWWKAKIKHEMIKEIIIPISEYKGSMKSSNIFLRLILSLSARNQQDKLLEYS